MAIFPANPQRLNPYPNFKFLLFFADRGTDPVAGISKVTSLRRTTEVIEHREGGDPSTERKSPGRTKYDAITFERGVTQDPDFEAWANLVWATGAQPGSEVALRSFRRDLILQLMNESGQAVLKYKIYKCWVSEYQALPDLDANANAVALQHVRIENEGWERDTSFQELSEP